MINNSSINNSSSGLLGINSLTQAAINNSSSSFLGINGLTQAGLATVLIAGLALIASSTSAYYAIRNWWEGRPVIDVSMHLAENIDHFKNSVTGEMESPHLLQVYANVDYEGSHPRPIDVTHFALKCQRYNLPFGLFQEVIDTTELGPSKFFSSGVGDGGDLHHKLGRHTRGQIYFCNIYQKSLSGYLRTRNYSGTVKLIAEITDQHGKKYKSRPFEYEIST